MRRAKRLQYLNGRILSLAEGRVPRRYERPTDASMQRLKSLAEHVIEEWRRHSENGLLGYRYYCLINDYNQKDKLYIVGRR